MNNIPFKRKESPNIKLIRMKFQCKKNSRVFGIFQVQHTDDTNNRFSLISQMRERVLNCPEEVAQSRSPRLNAPMRSNKGVRHFR